MRHALAILALLGACGGNRPAPTGAAEATGGPDCDAVSTHLVELATKDNGTAPSVDVAAGMRGELGRQCRDAPWTAERRQCLADATTQDETLECPAE